MPMGGQVLGSAILELGVNTRSWYNGLDGASKKFVQFGASLRVAAFRFGAIWASTVGVVVGGVLKMGVAFEKEFTGIKKTVDGTAAEFDKLKESLLSTAHATGTSAEQLAIIARKGGQLGVATKNLGEFTRTMAELGVAAVELPIEEAAEGLARLSKVTGEPIENIRVLGTVLARLGDEFATNESRILDFAGRISGLARVTNTSATELLAIGAAATQATKGVQLVGTQFAAVIANMAKAASFGGEQLELLNKITGTDFKAAFEKDAAGAIEKFVQGLGKLSQGQAFMALDKLGMSNRRAAQALLAAAGSAGEFTRALAIMRDEERLAGTEGDKLAKTMSTQMDTVFKKWDILWEDIRNAAIKFFDVFAEEIKDFLDLAIDLVANVVEIAEAFDKLPSPIKKAMIAVTLITSAVITLTGVIGLLASAIASAGPALASITGLASGATGIGAVAETLGAGAGGAGLGAAATTGIVGAGVVGAGATAYGMYKLPQMMGYLNKMMIPSSTLPEVQALAETVSSDLVPSFEDASDILMAFSDDNSVLTQELKKSRQSIFDNAKATAEWEAQLKAWSTEGWKHIEIMKSMREQADALAEAGLADISRVQNEKIKAAIPTGVDKLNKSIVAFKAPAELVSREMTTSARAAEEFEKHLRVAADIARAIGGTFGQIVGQLLSAASALNAFFKGGGISGIISGFGEGFSGFLEGISKAIPMIGSLVGPAISGIKAIGSALFGRGGIFGKASIESIVQNEMGVGISEGLAKAIEASGENIQLALAQIFQEGAMSVDQLATEMGDLFSFFERGEISETGLLGALEETVPLLIEHFKELGPAGEAQVQRIIEAARAMGIEFEGLGELISTSMGPSLQDVMEAFNLTNQQARELSNLLGVKLPTDTQILAAQLGVTPSQLKEIGKAMEEQFGIPLEQIQALMDMMGVDIEQLASALGVEGVEATDALKDIQEQANANIEQGAQLAKQLADELQRAAQASGMINIPAVSGSGNVISAQNEFNSGVLGRKTFFPIVAHAGEVVSVEHADKGGGGGGGSGFTSVVNLTIAEPLASPDDIQRVVVPPLIDAVRKDYRSFVGEISRKQARS